ncbi:MAG: glutaredoxin domain-containing protein [Candidatus ainarchaeum sp.]|nr:glutaredoxin domain-containing protein [Candidatus ainarchaeum sp.]
MSVKVYSTNACPFCVMVKDWLKDKKVVFEEFNVGVDQQKAQEMIDKSGQMGVPVIDISGNIIIGFDKPKLEKILKEKGLLK